jgi:hypothetical protein
MILATVSFMNSEETGAGYMNSSYLSRRQYAKDSLDFNMRNPLFRELFKRQIAELQKHRPSELNSKPAEDEPKIGNLAQAPN